MFANLTGWHFLAILAIILLVFGATRLPALSRSLGQSMRIFRSEMKKGSDDDAPESSDASTDAVKPADSLKK